VMDQTPPQVSLELEGREIDVDSTRDAALALAGDVAVTRKIFHIVKGGTAPLIHLSTRGNSWHDLGKGENILIKGSLLDGKIFVPGVHLDLEGVKGEVIISRGILEGKNLEARMGSIEGRQGTLNLGLKGENAPFHLDMHVWLFRNSICRAITNASLILWKSAAGISPMTRQQSMQGS
jgi:hypothetical protein